MAALRWPELLLTRRGVPRSTPSTRRPRGVSILTAPNIRPGSRLRGTRWVLHTNAISERGDGVNMLELTGALQSLGVDDVSVAFLGDHQWNVEGRIREVEAAGARLIPYARDTFRRTIRRVAPSHFMAFNSGAVGGNAYSEEWPHRYRFGDYIYITHAAFRTVQPHGDVYSYVSDWLLEAARERLARLTPAERRSARLRLPTVRFSTPMHSLPHAVTIEEGDRERFRSALGIPASANVVGRIGGRNQFNDPEARRAVEQLVLTDPDTWFVGANTEPFLAHERALFLPFLTRSRVHDFYAGIDVLLNGRMMGESFGLNLVEALRHDVPVIAPHESRNPRMDLHHTRLLADRPDWLYRTAEDIILQFQSLRERRFRAGARALVDGRFTREQLASGLEAIVPT